MNIQRYTPVLAGDWELDPMTASIKPTDDGEFVTYADHVAAMLTADRELYEIGEAMRAACIAAVESIPYTEIDGYPFVLRQEAVAVLKEAQP